MNACLPEWHLNLNSSMFLETQRGIPQAPRNVRKAKIVLVLQGSRRLKDPVVNRARLSHEETVGLEGPTPTDWKYQIPFV